MSLLDVSDITVKFGGITALDRLSFDIDEGEICALIGPNGAGKTTLFNVVSRIYDPTEGSVTFDDIDLLSLAPHAISQKGVYRTFQNLALWPGMTVLQNVMVGDHTSTKANFVTSMLRLGTRGEEKESKLRAWRALEELDLDRARLPSGGRPAVRHLEADRAGPRPDRQPALADARRASQRPHPQRGRRAG